MKRTPIILLAGTFDILHPGHYSLISQAQQYGKVTIIVARDENVIKEKGRIPCNDEQTRIRALRKVPGVSRVIRGRKHDKFASVLKICPDIIALGYDQKISIPELTTYLKERRLPTRIVRLKSYKPRQYKSHKLHP